MTREDCISRQAVLNGLASIAKVKARSNAQKSLMGRIMFFVEQLPPVTPRSLNPEADREESKAYCAECDHIEMCSWYPHDGCEWLKTDRYNAGYNAAKREIALSGEYERAYERGKQDAEQPRWIPVSERLPEELEPVNITWINHNPKSYYADIKDKPFTATGVYFNSQWYWWSTLCTFILEAYSHNYDDIIDDAIEVTAWMPLPEPYKAESENK